jgi:hypothetical protein
VGRGATRRGRAGWSAHTTVRGTVGAERGRAGRPARAAGQGETEGGGDGARCGAGLGQGRHEAMEGLRWPGVSEGRWGEPVAGAHYVAGSGGRHAAEARQGRVGVGWGVAGRERTGQSRGGRRVGSGEQGWPVHGEQTAGCGRAGRAGKNKKTDGIHKLGVYVPRPGRGT